MKLKSIIIWLVSYSGMLVLASACSQENVKQEHSSSSTPSSQVKLSQQAIDFAQLEILTAKPRYSQAKIVTTGEIKADENRVFHINSIVPGRVTKDNIVLGNAIKPGEILAVVENLDVARIYGEYIHQSHQNEIDVDQWEARLDLAKKNVARLEKLNKEGIVAEKDLIAAQSQQKLCQISLDGFKEHRLHVKAEAKSMLSAYGLDLEAEEKHGLSHMISGSPIRAPKPGIVIKKNVTVGDVVNPSEPLYVVADLSKVWLDITVYDKDLGKVKEGESVVFHSDSIPGTTFKGKISYIQPAAGDATKTFLARVILPNEKLVLKPGMFGQAEITAGERSQSPYLPDRALQKYKNDTFVFVKQNDGTYDKRKVTLGDRLGDGYLITDGISADEQVVGSGSFKLKSELLKSEIGTDE